LARELLGEGNNPVQPMNALLENPAVEPDPAPEQPTDEHLMERIQAGDSDALTELYRRRQSLFRTIIARLVNNDTDVDDLLQESLMEIWRTARHYRPERGHAIAWLVTLVRRRAIDRIRSKAAYRRAVDRFRDDSTVLCALMPARTEECFGQGDRTAAIASLIGKLPESQQDAVRLAFYQGMTQRQISANTGIPLGTIKTRIELGLRKLRCAALAFGELHDSQQ